MTKLDNTVILNKLGYIFKQQLGMYFKAGIINEVVNKIVNGDTNGDTNGAVSVVVMEGVVYGDKNKKKKSEQIQENAEKIQAIYYCWCGSGCNNNNMYRYSYYIRGEI